MNNNMLIVALFGDPMPVTGTQRNKLLLSIRRTRALRSWVKEGCYSWWRLTDDIKTIQKLMVKERNTE